MPDNPRLEVTEAISLLRDSIVDQLVSVLVRIFEHYNDKGLNLFKTSTSSEDYFWVDVDGMAEKIVLLIESVARASGNKYDMYALEVIEGLGGKALKLACWDTVIQANKAFVSLRDLEAEFPGPNLRT